MAAQLGVNQSEDSKILKKVVQELFEFVARDLKGHAMQQGTLKDLVL